MNDLEICKRIAEIDGAFKSTHDGIHVTAYFTVGCGVHTYESTIHGYNPLTDDALCFQLIEKYKVLIDWANSNNDCMASIFIDVDNNVAVRYSDLKRAVAMVIIKSKDQS